MNTCNGTTKSLKKCQRKCNTKYCFQHKDQDKEQNQEIEQYKEQDKQDKIEEQLNDQLREQNDYISKLEEENKYLKFINKDLKEEVLRLYDVDSKYKIILEFEKMKSDIKKLFNWKRKQFYIEIIRKEHKYHNILENMFNMPIDKIIEKYWRLRELRLKYCHPYN